MKVVGIIIAIFIVLGILKCILEKAGEFAKIILQIIAGIGILIGGFFLIKFLFGIVVKALHFLICLIPKWFIYSYSSLFIIFIVLWFIRCILNVYLSGVIEDEFCTISMIATMNEIYSALKDGLIEHTSGITKLAIRVFASSAMCHNIVARNCVEISSGFCTYAVVCELSYVLSEEGMVTDLELIDSLECRIDEITKELFSLKENMEDLRRCLKRLEFEQKIEIIDGIPCDGENAKCIENKVYRAKNTGPNPKNMLPPQHYCID